MRIKVNGGANGNVIDFEGVFNQYLSKIYKKFSFDLHVLSKIVRIFFTKLNNYYGNVNVNADKK